MSGIVSAIVIGIVIGVLGRFVVPGRQRIGVLWTILVGMAAAFAGTGIAAGFDVADSKGVDWVERLIQIGLAALGVAALDRIKGAPPLSRPLRRGGYAGAIG
ncbi:MULTISPECIES: GlsB/YeaQ/YmgE family stress response membrane protein [unclassified Streptomyces]|uniref:GlsB/YeaQ/YmgE family stress response membrane protein n=1 Tax=unclassified Streptomyces TaxID=2593676 RepID=UPI00366527FF